ncbi:acetyl-CoA hydrolase/transferase family protein [Thermogymnomonas acidicola]|uniref:acetyl-CoA hydrolase/transferase family protein n=1 Tax=Thermogymnomonas acidicola TaxID=399579 RepID=UPI001E2FC259|nr:acetyl-CoA hydrolase/transferase C-terminal domain-containing protein [Thermogymnomonas acidicola]
MIELTQSALREILREAKNVYIQGGASTPTYLLDMIGEMDIGGLSFYHIELGGDVFLFREDHTDRFRDYSFFVGANARDALQKGWTRYIPIFLSDIPWFLRTQIRLDLAIVNVSTPDSKGMMSLGPTVEAAKVAVEVARRTIAQVNGEVPRTFGDSLITPGMVSHFLRHDEPLHVTKRERPDEVDMKIGRNVAELIPDGATVQAGIGKVPDAVMLSLSDRRDLGVHTELISDGIVELMERGVVNNRLKAIDRYHTVGTFAKGERKVFDYLDDNTSVQMRSVEYTNDTSVIRRNRMMHSINSAVEVDLTGQVSAESIGPRVISGVGGQMDFVRGSSLSEGGKSIIALRSTTRDGKSKIVPFLMQGTGVTTTRNHVQYVVTEYGVAELRGKTIQERVTEMVSVAHPRFRSELEEEASRILRA